MAHYTVTADVTADATTLTVAFGDPGSNDRIVKDAVAALAALALKGGPVVKVTGPASLPVAMAISHAVAHLFGAVAAYDPKLGKYVVAVSHSPALAVGDLID